MTIHKKYATRATWSNLLLDTSQDGFPERK